MIQKTIVALTGACSLLCHAPRTLAQCGVHGDILVGKTGDGTLAVAGAEFELDDFIALCPVDGLLQGYTSGNPGFDAAEVVNDPENDFFELQPGAMIAIESVALHPAFKAWGPGLATLIDGPGETIALGGNNLHEHLTWHADANDPDFDPSDVFWTATFRLIDTGTTGYAPSEPFTLQFVRESSIPAVSEWGLLSTALAICTAFTLLFRGRSGP